MLFVFEQSELASLCILVILQYNYAGRAVTAGRTETNVFRTCGPIHLLLFGFMSEKE